jgi:hypothetical protein
MNDVPALHDYFATIVTERPLHRSRDDVSDLFADVMMDRHMASGLEHNVSDEHLFAYQLSAEQVGHRIVLGKS